MRDTLIGEAGRIHGAYHKPLSELAQTCGIPCEVAANLSTARIRREVSNSRHVILSVDLAKVDGALRGGHLVLIYAYNAAVGEFLLHDCSSVLRQNGRAVNIAWSELETISNRKGLVAGLEFRSGLFASPVRHRMMTWSPGKSRQQNADRCLPSG